MQFLLAHRRQNLIEMVLAGELAGDHRAGVDLFLRTLIVRHYRVLLNRLIVRGVVFHPYLVVDPIYLGDFEGDHLLMILPTLLMMSYALSFCQLTGNRLSAARRQVDSCVVVPLRQQ